MTQRTIVIASFSLFFATLLWGGYSLVIYLGLPIHQLVYLTQEEVQTWNVACDQQMEGAAANSINFCRGAGVILTFIGKTLGMASPFLGYTIVSVLLFMGILLYQGYHTGSFSVRVRWRPAFLIFLFIGSVWLLGTTFSLGSLYNVNSPENVRMGLGDGTSILPPFNRFFEPTAAVYSSAGPEALAELKANYEDLLSRGCLHDTLLTTQQGAHVYDLSFFCIQQSMISRVGLQIIMIAFFLLNLLVLGRFVLTKILRLPEMSVLLLSSFSIGIGALSLIAILWCLAIFGVLSSPVTRVIFFGMPVLLFPQTLWWLRQAWNARFEVDLSYKNWHLYVGWLLLTYLALNFLNVVRPFPIGWDDLGSYLNRPRLLSSYGYWIPSMSQFQWEYLTSLGFLIFGYDSSAGSTFAMQINWSAGLLAVLAVYTLGRTYFGKKGGLLSAMLYYFLPMTGHFSFADMKIDNASFFTIVLAVIAVLLYCFAPSNDEENTSVSVRHHWQIVVLAGLLAGLSFGIKPTAVLGILMMLTILSGSSLGVGAAFGAFFVGLAVLQQFGALSIVEVSSRAALANSISRSGFLYGSLLIGAVGIGYGGFRYRDHVQQYIKSVGLFVIGILVACLPWMAYNVLHSDTVSTSTMLAAQDRTSQIVSYLQKDEVEALAYPPEQTVRYLPPELALNPDNAACKGSARTEELDRYWGFDKGLSHYLTLPWRQVMNLDTFGYYVSFPPILLLFLLLLLNPVFWNPRWTKIHLIGAAGIGVFLVHALLSLTGVDWYRSALDGIATVTVGRYIGYGLILGFLALPLTALFWKEEFRWLGYLFAGTWFFIIEWSLVGNGIGWYGIGMFVGIVVALEASIRYAPDEANRRLMVFFFVASIAICLTNRLWQFDSQKNLFEYPLGKVSATALREVTIPDYDNIRQSVVERSDTMPDTPYTYRIGTFISYFIPRNREIFPLADHQLTFFSCLNQEQDHVLTLKRLRALGFNSFIFDTNTHTIEKDPNGSLHQKVNKFLDFVNDPQIKLDIMINDPGNGIAYILLPVGAPETPKK